MSQGIGQIGELTVLGVEFCMSRGVSPSSGLVRLLTEPFLDKLVDTLTLTDGGNSISLTKVAVADVSQRNFLDRDGLRWDAVIQDRRWLWRYPRISGHYNRRLCDGEVDEWGKKNARELGELLAEALDEPSFDVSSLPTDVWPEVNWDNSIARFELQTLADKFGLVVCPKLDDTFALEPITDTASLPAGGAITNPGLTFKPSIMPSLVRVAGTRKYKQGWVELQPLGLDTDGSIRLIDSLSYSPGWGTQWPSALPDVSPADRYLAFETLYRWYGPVDETIVLTPSTVETGLDVPANRRRCLPMQVRGEFFCHDDFGTTTPSTAIYSGKYRLKECLNLIEFAYPVFKYSAGVVEPATLWVNTAYYHVDADGNPIDEYTKDEPVADSIEATEPRVLWHPELRFIDLVDPLYQTIAGDNRSQLDSEADVYLGEVVLRYSFQFAQEVIYQGLVPIDLSGGVSQILWRAGNDRVAITRVGLNHEFGSVSQSTRSAEHVSQMAERMGV